MKKYQIFLALSLFMVLGFMPSTGQADSGYSPYCGDGIINQSWEQCDGGSTCSLTCQDTTASSCSDLALARVVVDEVQNTGANPATTADMTSDIYLGSLTNRIPAGAWFPIFLNGAFITDDDLGAYEDVPGSAVERGDGEIRLVMHGSNKFGKEHVHGSIETKNINVIGVRGDTGSNVLENGFDGNGVGEYRAGDDEVWLENGVAKFWLTTTAADDGFYAELGSGPICEEEELGAISVCKIVLDEDGNIVDGSGLDGVFSIGPRDDSRAVGVLPTTVFTLPLTLNTDLFGDSANDAQCVLYDDLTLGSYFLGEEVIQGDGWLTPLYNDQLRVSFDSLADAFPYDLKNANSNGHISLIQKGPERTLIIVNQSDGSQDSCEVDDSCEVENLPPSITLLGDAVISLNAGGTFTDPGATASDPEDGDITSSIVVGGDAVVTTTVGTYVITYNVVDSSGVPAPEKSRTVKVKDGGQVNMAPTITLLGDSLMKVTVGDTFTDPGATASDPEDGDITKDIVVGGDTVDTTTVGTYVITYNVTDSDGAPASQFNRTVTVSSGGGGGGSVLSRMLINDGDSETDSVDVELTLIPPSSVDEVMISNKADFDGGVWEPFVAKKSWILESIAGERVVYAKFRRAGHDVGYPINDAILLSIAEVLGEATEAPICGVYLNSYLRLGGDNDEFEVKKLQQFLNDHGYGPVIVSGVFDTETFEAVKAFQLAEKEFVLEPWVAFGLDPNTPTGFVYKTTVRRINQIMCPSLVLPALVLP